MSYPKFPEIDPNMTFESAINMILTSIAMEELALSHIMNAEGEKIQYILGKLCKSETGGPNAERVIEVNQSVTQLLESVARNQELLKMKMDKVLEKRPNPPHPYPPVPPIPPVPPHPCPPETRCSAVFKSYCEDQRWCAGKPLSWTHTQIQGKCASLIDEGKKISLPGHGRFMIGFALNLKDTHCYMEDIAISIKLEAHDRKCDVFTYHWPVSNNNELTATASGVIVETHGPSAVFLRLVSPGMITVKNSIFNIMEC